MSSEEYKVTSDTYEAKYESGYGLKYPDGHVIRFHRQILEYELGLTTGTILDYGCGTGIHLHYFEQNGYTPYGCDISSTAIEKCKSLMPTYAENFHVIPTVPRLRDYFSVDLDIVFSNQVLYYLTDRDLHNVVSQFYLMLKHGGILFATMIAPTNYYSRFVQGTQEGLSKVVLRGRLNETTFVNFKTKEEVLKLFTSEGFTKFHLGFYGSIIREDEGPTDHHMFVGRK